MAAWMAAMMVPTAVPFFVAYGRAVRRPAPAVVVILVYAAVWAVIGVAAFFVMNQVMLPTTGLVAGIAVAFVGIYALTPRKRHGQAACQEMCREPEPDPSLRAAAMKGLVFSGNCILCSTGVMVALVVLGMSNILLMVVGAALVLVYKLEGRWTRRLELVASIVFVLAAAWLVFN